MDMNRSSMQTRHLHSVADFILERFEGTGRKVLRATVGPMRSTCAKNKAPGLFNFLQQCCCGTMREKLRLKAHVEELEACLCEMCGWDHQQTLIAVDFMTTDHTAARQCWPAFNRMKKPASKSLTAFLPLEESGAVMAIAKKSNTDPDSGLPKAETVHMPQFCAVIVKGDTLHSPAFRLLNSVHGNACLRFSIMKKRNAPKNRILHPVKRWDMTPVSHDLPMHHLKDTEAFVFKTTFGQNELFKNANLATCKKSTMRNNVVQANVLQNKVLAEAHFAFFASQMLPNGTLVAFEPVTFSDFVANDNPVMEFHLALKHHCPKHNKDTVQHVFEELAALTTQHHDNLCTCNLSEHVCKSLPIKHQHVSVRNMLKELT